MSNYDESYKKASIEPPAQDICQGWYLRNRASNVELSSLVPAAHLYVIMDQAEVNNLADYLQQGSSQNNLMTPVVVKQDGEYITFDSTSPELDEEEFRNRTNEINQQILKDVISAKIKYPFREGHQKDFEHLEDTTVLVPLAQMKSQVSTNDYVKGSYGGVGVDSLNSNLINSQGINRRISLNLTFTNPNIIDLNYAYQKLLTLNTKYIIVYGWYNGSGGNSVFSPQTTDPTGKSSQEFEPYPVTKGEIPGEKRIEIDCTNQNTGGFWSAHKVVLNSYNFNANDLGQLEGTFTFIDELASRLSQTSVAKIAPFIKGILKSGETLGGQGGFEVNDQANFIGDGMAEEIKANQTVIFSGISNILHSVGDKRIGEFLTGLADAEDDDIFGSPASLLENAGKTYADRGFPFGGPGIVQYEVNKKPISNFSEDSDRNIDEDTRETVYETEYQSRINFYFLGWLTESVRYGLGALNSDARRESYVNAPDEIEQFGVNFYYEQLPENSLFAVQYKRLLESTQLKDIKAVNRKIMSYIEETALPPFDANKEWQQLISATNPFTLGGRNIKNLLNLPKESVIGKVSGGSLKFASAVEFDTIILKKTTYGVYRTIVKDQKKNTDEKGPFVIDGESYPGKIKWSTEYGMTDISGVVDNTLAALLREEYGDEVYGTDGANVPGLSVFLRSGINSEIEYISSGKITGPVWIAHLWIPYEYFKKYEGEELSIFVAALRYILNPQLYINTMKKWWTEARKATLKDIQEKVTERLFRLEQEGKTVLDILNEPIDLDWLTSRHPASWEEDIQIEGAPRVDGSAGMLRAAIKGGDNQYSIPIGGRGYGDNRMRHYTTGLYSYPEVYGEDGIQGRIQQSEGTWNPYRKDIPDTSDKELDPTMEILDLIWQTRAVNGRKDVNNYGPAALGSFYDNVTEISFVPQNIYAGVNLESWAEPNRKLQKAMIELFNQSVTTDENGVQVERNILDILSPGFTGIDLEQYSTRAQVKQNEEVQDQIDRVNQGITERALFMLMVPAAFSNLQETAGVNNIEDIKGLELWKTFALRDQNQGQNFSIFMGKIRRQWQVVTDKRSENEQYEWTAEYREARYAERYRNDTDEHGYGYDKFIAYIDAKIEEIRNKGATEDYSLIDEGFMDTVIGYFGTPTDLEKNTWSAWGAADAADYFKTQLIVPGHDANGLGESVGELNFVSIPYYNNFNKIARSSFIDRGAPPDKRNRWKPSDTVLQQVQDPVGAENWFIKMNNDELEKTNGGVFQPNLNEESFKELFDILLQKNIEDLAIVRSLQDSMHPFLGPADLGDKTKEALEIIGDYFNRLMNRSTEFTTQYNREDTPPINFYIEKNEESEWVTEANVNLLSLFSGKPRFEVLYKGFPIINAGLRIGQNGHNLELTLKQKESLVRNNPIRNSTTNSEKMAIGSDALAPSAPAELAIPSIQNTSSPSARDLPGLGDSRTNSKVTVFSYVGQMMGLGHLSDSVELFEDIVDFEAGEDKAVVMQANDETSGFSRFMVGGRSINQKYGNYMANLMALNPGGRRIIVRKKQRFDGGEGNGFIDPTYGDALGYYTGGSTYGDIRNKVPQSVADIAIRRDVVDNMLRPNNHKMNLLDFLTQITAPTAIAAVGGTASLALRNLNGILSIKPLGITQDGVLEDYSDMVMTAAENIRNDTEGNEYFGRDVNQEMANNLIQSFYIYYKKKFSLVQSVSIAAKADPMYAATQIGNNSKWFDGGFSRNFLRFLGYGNTAFEFRDFVSEKIENSPGVHWLKNEQGNVIENFANQIITVEGEGDNKRVTVDSALIQKLPSTFISEFVGLGTDNENALVQYWLRENATDISSVYKHYLKRVTITLHGTANLMGFQKLFIDNVLPGMAGVFEIINVTEQVNGGNYTTSVECWMRHQVPPEKILNSATGRFVATPESSE